MSTGTLVGPPRLFEPIGEGGTLDELIVSSWEAIRAHRSVECPVCGHEMTPEYGVHARAIGGRCSDCGSTLR